MIARPTTQQILDHCSRQLMEVVLPAVTDQTVQVTIYMMDLVLRNAAMRAAHEIAWMTEETAQLEDFAGTNGRHAGAAAESLHLDDAVERYCTASEAFSRALEDALAAGDDEREARGRDLLARRIAHEQEIMCGWSPVGR
jgi:hypothetical protein